MARQPAPDKATREYEIRFMKRMVDHHLAGVMMAGLSQERAVHKELKSLSRDMAVDQIQEIVTMLWWLEDWYGVRYKPDMPMRMREMDRLEHLKGERYETEFMETMIRHHEEAIEMAEEARGRVYHRELEDLANNIIESQQREVEMMTAWLRQWYGIEPEEERPHMR
ncbi:MAG: DUF305 domain-containing protein [Candidatus Aquicultorales bacterium]